MKKSETAPMHVEQVSKNIKDDLWTVSVAEHGMIESLISLKIPEGVQRVRVQVGAGSRARFLMEQPSGNMEVHFVIEPNAFVDLFFWCHGKEPRLSKNIYHLKKHSSLNVWTFADAESLQMDHEVHFEEEHAFASLHGLSLLDGASSVTHRVHANHKAGHCVSRQFYKSIVGGSSLSNFESLVSVSRDAAKSDSKQLNKNLVLSRQAKAVSRPELKIETDDVACAHGSATGELDESIFFYLQSRGIDASQARRVMMDGFAQEVLEDVHDATIKKQLAVWTQSKLKTLEVSLK